VRLEDFWALIQDSSSAAKGQRERTEWLTRRLAGLPVPAIIEFELHLAAHAAPEDEPWDYDAPNQRLAKLPRLTALLG
jgi:Protein of unknown function (DUF4240)